MVKVVFLIELLLTAVLTSAGLLCIVYKWLTVHNCMTLYALQAQEWILWEMGSSALRPRLNLGIWCFTFSQVYHFVLILWVFKEYAWGAYIFIKEMLVLMYQLESSFFISNLWRRTPQNVPYHCRFLPYLIFSSRYSSLSAVTFLKK